MIRPKRKSVRLSGKVLEKYTNYMRWTDDCACTGKIICFGCVRKKMAKRKEHKKWAAGIHSNFFCRSLTHTHTPQIYTDHRNRNTNNKSYFIQYRKLLQCDELIRHEDDRNQKSNICFPFNTVLQANPTLFSFQLFIFPLPLSPRFSTLPRITRKKKKTKEDTTSTAANSSGFRCWHESVDFFSIIYSMCSRN